MIQDEESSSEDEDSHSQATVLLAAPEPEPVPQPEQTHGRSIPAISQAILLPTRSGRVRRAPRGFQDLVPSARPGQLEYRHVIQLAPPSPARSPSPQPEEVASSQETECDHSEEGFDVYETKPDVFCVFRRYLNGMPSRDPEDEDIHDDRVDSNNIVTITPMLKQYETPLRSFAIVDDKGTPVKWFAPFINPSAFRLMWWAYTGANSKCHDEMHRLVHQVIRAKDFKPDDLENFSMTAEERRLDRSLLSTENLVWQGWKTQSVEIPLPKERVKYRSEGDAPKFTVSGILTRSLTSIMSSTCTEKTGRELNYDGYKLLYRDSDANRSFMPELERLYCETYDSDAYLEEEAKVRSQPRNPEDDPSIPYCIFTYNNYSDNTHLTNFGVASLWPAYSYPGNMSKYKRMKGNSFCANHIAYAPTLPDTIQDAYKETYGEAATGQVLRFCKVELTRAVWLLLLDDEFMYAYRHGRLEQCADGILRRMFPRLFAHSADYPERVLLLALRFLAQCPCPTCLTEKKYIPQMGLKTDERRRNNHRQDDPWVHNLIQRARKLIFEKGLSIHSTRVEALLKDTSLLPLRNAFSTRLVEFGVNSYHLFPPDVMHELELGVGKSLTVHILRVLHAIPGDHITELNERFRAVPTFGNTTIRRFGINVSGLKKLAARDYEDILQCIIPCLEGLLPPDLDKIVADMLFFLLLFHALAKMRLHRESTVRIMESVVRHLGKAVRVFAKKSKKYPTKELPNEVAARGRREIRAAKQKTQNSETFADRAPQQAPSRLQAKLKFLNLSTFKWHNLPHYPWWIRRIGALDGYSTQAGEGEHKRCKKFYSMTNKNNHEPQIATKERREHALRKLKEQDEEVIKARNEAQEGGTTETGEKRKRGRPHKVKHFAFDLEDKEEMPQLQPERHHQIAESQQFPIDIKQYAYQHRDDPAMRHFVCDLKDHLLSRLRGHTFNGGEHEFTDEDRAQITIRKDRIYRHMTLRVNYTTYDMRREQDSINPRTHPDIMVLNPGEDDIPKEKQHPYWYARVVGIFHANVQYTDQDATTHDTQRVEFLWVRWFGYDFERPGGFKTLRLHRVGFVPENILGAFGFLDPSVVIRSVHLIGAFAYGRIGDLMGPSIVRQYQEEDDDQDWRYLYVNMFVDRDMILRYLGGGVGHLILRGIVRIAEAMQALIDADALDMYGEEDEEDMDNILVEEDEDDCEEEDEDEDEEGMEEDMEPQEYKTASFWAHLASSCKPLQDRPRHLLLNDRLREAIPTPIPNWRVCQTRGSIRADSHVLQALIGFPGYCRDPKLSPAFNYFADDDEGAHRHEYGGAFNSTTPSLTRR
ncbi:hypothetical protein NM688_g3120 [Phlebia brevispora]|uniref:Uncharacterized protein n=1 Tax=Phlebia brevispora TaxID=194682 RepID=A0ACC1T6F0_9APHY|nr:hypothetical protein NM688_g3120 [Phlebia brevispora]